MTKPSNPPSSTPRPFSMRPEDFLKGASEAQVKAATETTEDALEAPAPEGALDEDLPPPSFRRPDAAPTGSAGRASTHSRPMRPVDAEDQAPKRKDEHTILMAVPPPAQENKGK